jgi:flagellar basal-body rod protein FlgF
MIFQFNRYEEIVENWGEKMLRGLYTAASGMLAQQRRTELLTNNMANANTPGFKADQSSMRAFPEMLLQRLGTEKLPLRKQKHLPYTQFIGSINAGVYMQEAIPKFTQGDLRETGRKTDLAIVDGVLPVNEENNVKGSLFFTVETPNGIRYTRNGNFTLNPEGFLTTNEGYYVLDENGSRIQLTSEEFHVRSDGTIMENNTFVAAINVVFAENPYELIKEGNGLYAVENNGTLPSARNNRAVSFSLKQGFLERSNVDVAQTMTEMLTAYRAFEANQKVLQAYDKSLDKAVNEIGRIR